MRAGSRTTRAMTRRPRSPIPMLFGLGLCALLALPAAAQQNSGGVPPYEPDLLKLSEILGALHYIRPLCGAAEGTRWREEMQEMLDAEQPSDTRRGQLIAAFNNGYESYRQVYHSCTASAQLASQRYLEAGAKLSRDIAARYGSN
ncbi:TIGR02301 family protein [Ancylobacter sp. A5.8]|uniref:TIGR02301 family protein n=1 Tax=Ancylobacter gelatini TaxID=2919920 RepID=UPI001F4EB3CF|nr:TIGR02301 family protein [Ancylobacter gelatini]